MAPSTKVLADIGKAPEASPEPSSRRDRLRMLAHALDSAKTVDERTEVLEAILELRGA